MSFSSIPGDGEPHLDDEEDLDLGDFPGLRALGRFARLVPDLGWFQNLGNELDEDEIEWAEAYLAEMGFPDSTVAPVGDWEEAADAAASADWNSPWWEAEEGLRAALMVEACARIGEERLEVALAHLAARAADAIRIGAEVAAARDGVIDEELVRAAAGAAAQAAHQAALVLAAEIEDEHPFALKFRLFETGRWPIGLTGHSFHLY